LGGVQRDLPLGGVVSRFEVEGPAVLVPGRVAALLEKTLKLDTVRSQLRGADRETDEVLLAIRVTGLRWAEGRSAEPACDHASDVHKVPQVGGRSDMTTRQVANALGISTAAVTLAAREGRLDGRQVGGQWRFDMDSVAVWKAMRRRQ
jgi:excisionase family DNA binding protein